MLRNRQIDTAKYIGIVLVIWGHLTAYDLNTMTLAINMSHMPFFFAISGFFIYDEVGTYNFKELLVKKSRRLLFPYFIWSSVSFILHICIEGLSNNGPELKGIIREAVDIFIYSRSVWFLWMLFFSEILFIVCYFLFSRLRIHFIICISIVYLLLFFVLPDHILAFSKFRWLFPFMAGGFLLNKRSFSIIQFFNNGSSRKVCVKHIIIYMLAIAYFAISDTYLDRTVDCFMIHENRMVLKDMLLWLTGGVVGTVAIIALACLVNNTWGIFSAIGRYTMDIYVIHMFFVYIFRDALTVVRNTYIKNIFACLLSVIITVIIYCADKNLLRRSSLFRFSLGIRDNNLKGKTT